MEIYLVGKIFENYIINRDFISKKYKVFIKFSGRI